MITFLINNWSPLLALIISVIALIVAIRSNNYAQRISSAQLDMLIHKVVYKSDIDWVIYVKGYNYPPPINQDFPYELRFDTYREEIIANNGGLSTVLLKSIFLSGQNPWNTKIFYFIPPDAVGEEAFMPEIPTGSAKRFLLEAETVIKFRTISEAMTFSSGLNNQKIKNPGKWLLIFSDGKDITRKCKNGRYLISPDINKELGKNSPIP
jgi:hypothetical protein